MLHSNALNPASAYRIQPFWFWNGEMEEREVERQIREMADKGLGGFFICPRQGLKIPYLSELWFEKVRYAVDLAAQYGLEVWLYDEYPYPSGIAGGEVLLKHPDAKHKTLAHRSVRVAGGEKAELALPWGQVLYAKAVPVDQATGKPQWHAAVDVAPYVGNLQDEHVFQKVGLTAYNNKRYFTYNPQKRLCWQAPADSGTWEVLAFVAEEVSDFKYYGTFVDPLHQEAMRTFIELTHQKYADALGDRMGSTVKGMFTDEIGLLGHLPWSPVIAGHMKQTYGTDLHAQLPTLLYDTGDATAKLRYQFYQSIHELLRDNYHLQVNTWCEQHGLQYIAEVPSVRMSTQLYSHIPGLDSAHEKLGRSLEWILNRYAHSFRYNPKMITSLARQLGRERVLVECFHSVGWSMTLQDAKWMIDRLAALGVNMFNFHAFYYTTDGLTKHDAPPSQFLQNPYWSHFRLLADYTARLSVLMSEGSMRTELAVLHPTASIWAHMGNPFHEFRYCGDDEAEAKRLAQLKDDWHAICKALTWSQRDFDHLDTEILCQADVSGGRIRIGKADYSVLIIPPVSCLESEAWDVIRRFAEGGGTVIGVGLLPYQVIDERVNVEEEALDWFGLDRSTRHTYWGDASVDQSGYRTIERRAGQGRVYFVETRCGLQDSDAEQEFIRIVEEAAPGVIKLQPADALASASTSAERCFLIQHRELTADADLVFISNQEGGSHQLQLVYTGRLWALGGQLSVELLDLVTGEKNAVPITVLPDGQAAIPLAFAPYEAHAVRLYKTESAAYPVTETATEEKKRAAIRLDCLADWELTAEQDNIVRLGAFELTVNGHSESMTVQAKTFIDQASDLAEHGQQLPLRFHQEFGIPMEAKLAYPAVCRYETGFHVDEMPPACKLVKERGSIAGNYTIYINGHAVKEEQFSPDFHYDYLNQSCSILPYLTIGHNQLLVEVEVAEDWEGVVNAIYIAGDFGVEAVREGEAKITRRPGVGRIQGSSQAGFPYYAGTIRLCQQLRLDSLPEETEFDIEFMNGDPHFHDCMEVIVNDTTLAVCAWSPYRFTGNSSLLRTGVNQVEVRLTTTLIGMLEGKRFDYADHLVRDIIEER